MKFLRMTKVPTYVLKENGINYLYHITRKENLKSILRHGLLSRNLCMKKGIGVEEIGDEEIVWKRGIKMLPKSDARLNDYVPLYFNPRNAMMYRVCKDSNAYNLVILAFDSKVIFIPGTIFTDGNAASNDSNFYYSKYDLEKLDWEIIKNRYWCFEGIVDVEIRRKMMAEVLVKERIPRRYLKKLICNSEKSAEDLISLVKGKMEIEVSKDMFFDK